MYVKTIFDPDNAFPDTTVYPVIGIDSVRIIGHAVTTVVKYFERY